MALTPKQEQFVAEYLIDLNATQAAIRAGYSEKNASKIASELLDKTQVRTAIDVGKTERSQKTNITAERVLAEIANMAFYDPADLMLGIDPDELDHEPSPAIVVEGQVIHGLRGPADIKRLPENVRRAIVGWGYDRNQNFTVKLADKSKALDQLARHLSLYNDKLEVTGVDALADRLARAANRDG